MTFEQADTEIRALLAETDLLTLYYEKQYWHKKYSKTGDTTCTARWCVGVDCTHAEAPTWQGVIDKIKIHLMPKGEPTSEEAPNEADAPEPKP